MKQKILTMILLASLTVSMLTGCGQTETASTADTQTTETTAQPEEPEQAEEVVTESTETEIASAEEPEATTEPSTEEVTPELTEEPEPTEEPAPEYTYTDMNATMYATQTVNVRNLPSTDGEKVGSLSTNQEVAITGQASTGWYRIEYNGGEAYVSNKYLSDEKVEVQAPAEKPADNVGSGTGSAASGSTYQTGVWYDMGEYFFVMCNNADEASYFYGHHYEVSPTLEARYPDRDVYIISRNNNITLVAALHKTAEGFPNWDEINYIPELGMN